MIDKILKFDLCLGCGLCESCISDGKCKMTINENGFFAPSLSVPLTPSEDKLIGKLCPGIRVHTKSAKGYWGKLEEITESWSADPVIRHKAASGGVVSSLAIHLLETKKVDAVLQVGVAKEDPYCNELKISRTREDILENAQSRYAPARVFNRVKEILYTGRETFAFIGKPCDIAGMRNFLAVYPEFGDRVRYFISIFCAGMPSLNGTKEVCKQSGKDEKPLRIRYRGDGWPGCFKAEFKDGTSYETSYDASWGGVLSRYLPFRCKICPDGIGMLADIAVGDSWATTDGYPDFTEAEGRSFCMVRTRLGVELMREAERSGYIVTNPLNVAEVQFKQPYQFDRRKLTGWRLLPVQILSGWLISFRGLGIVKLSLGAKFMSGLRNGYGTFRRLCSVLKRHGK